MSRIWNYLTANEFRQKIVLVVLDKLIFGAVLVGLGYLANKAIENFKGREALRIQYAKTSLDKTSQIWTKAASLRETCQELMTSWAGIEKLGGDALKVLQRETDELDRLLTVEQFWIPPNTFRIVSSNMAAIDSLFSGDVNTDHLENGIDRIRELRNALTEVFAFER